MDAEENGEHRRWEKRRMIYGCNKMKKVGGDFIIIIGWRWRLMRILSIALVARGLLEMMGLFMKGSTNKWRRANWDSVLTRLNQRWETFVYTLICDG